MNAIEVAGVTKDFPAGWAGGTVRALDGVTLRIRQGDVVGLLGPNGSGKSTLLKVILGLLAPTAGECRLFGVPNTRREARAAVGYLPETPRYPPHLTGSELVHFYARLSGLPRARLEDRVGRAMAGVGLAEAGGRRVGSYSHGMRQRLGLAQALVHDPDLVILDEPMAGLDPVGTAETGRMISRLKAEGRTVLFTSHLLSQVTDICDCIALLHRGRLVLEGLVADLTRRLDQMVLTVDPLAPATLGELRGWLQVRGVRMLGAEAPRRGLEQVFLEAVQGAGGREDGSS